MENYRRKEIYTAVLLLAMAVILPSCMQISRHKQLKDIWTYIDAAPDSALQILDKMSSKDFTLASDRASYALLKSIALDKNYIDVKDDSLSRIAINWYSLHGSMERKLRAWYYHGRVQQNAGNASGAIVSFQRAEEESIKGKDRFYEGMANRAMSDVYRNAFIWEDAKEKMLGAYNCFLACNHERHADYALLDLAEICYTEGDIDKSEDYLALLLKRMKERNDSSLYISFLSLKGAAKVRNQDYREAIQYYSEMRKYSGDNLSSGTLGSMSYAYYMTGQRDSAFYYLSQALGKISSEAERIAGEYDKYRLAFHEKDYETAIQNLRTVLYAQDSTFHAVLNQSVVAAQRDAYKESYQITKERIKRRNIGISFIGLLVVFLIAYIMMFAKQKKIEEENLLYQIISLKEDVFQMEGKSSEKDQMIAGLLRQRLLFINDISISYLRTGSSHEIGKTIVKEIEDYRKDQHNYEEMERIVNYTCEGAMDLLHKEVEMTSNQYQIMCYYFADLSTAAIRLLTGETQANIYKIKQRLKRKLETEQPQHLQLFLRYLSR